MPRRRLWAFTAVVLGGVVAAALPQHPGFQEWRCRGKSLTELHALERQFPESPIVLYHLGDALHRAGRDKEAAALLQRAARFDESSVRVHESLTATQLALGQTRPTFDLLRGFLERHPETPEAYHLLSRFLMGVQTYSRAIPVLEEATRRFPDDARGFLLLASAKQSFRDLRGAQDAATRATRLAPENADAWLLEARIQNERGVPNRARDAYLKAVHLAPNDVELKAECADFIARQPSGYSDRIFGRDIARRVLQQNPGHAKASGALGVLLADQKSDLEAAPLLQRALKASPHDTLILRTLVLLAKRNQQAGDAARYGAMLTRAQTYRDEEKRLLDGLSARPRDPALLRRMARLTGRNGDALKSLRYHAIARGVSPDAPVALLAAAQDLRDGGFDALAGQYEQRAQATGQFALPDSPGVSTAP